VSQIRKHGGEVSAPVERGTGVDEMDQNILRVLSSYDQLTPLQVWYELGEDEGVKERITEGEALSRLESLKAKGLVEGATAKEVNSDSGSLIYRMKTRADVTGER
jgi:hypothetical protein